MTTLYRLRVLATIAAACALPVIYLALFEVANKLTRFEDLQIGDSYWEANPQVGYKLITKILPDVAATQIETCSGRQRNVRVDVRPSHKVRKVENDS